MGSRKNFLQVYDSQLVPVCPGRSWFRCYKSHNPGNLSEPGKAGQLVTQLRSSSLAAAELGFKPCCQPGDCTIHTQLLWNVASKVSRCTVTEENSICQFIKFRRHSEINLIFMMTHAHTHTHKISLLTKTIGTAEEIKLLFPLC